MKYTTLQSVKDKLPKISSSTVTALMLIIGTIATEAHGFLYLVNPTLANKNANRWFIARTLPFEISVEWWIKSFVDKGYLCMIFYIAAAQAYRSNNIRVFLVIGIYFLYWFANTFLLLYNWGYGPVKYWVLLVITISSTIVLIYPESSQGKLRKM